MYHFSGDVLRRHREAKGMRRESLALLLNRSACTVGYYETDRVDPNAEQLGQMAQALGCHPGDLFIETP